ncbi:MAG: CpsB/CapC family capsule biosynthesis tyrosine phosphatase [Bacilli bacterium]
MIDIHTHIIPNIDDGSNSLTTSINMIKEEIVNGVDTIILTPHYRYRQFTPTKEEILTNYNLLLNEVNRLKLNIKLSLGEEIYYTNELDIISLLKEGKLLTLNNSKYVLIEFNYHEPIEDVKEVIYSFLDNNYLPIIAHVERYTWMDIDLITSLKSIGALIQVNSSTIVGKDGFKQKRLVKKLHKLKLIDVVSSDIHSFRSSTMLEASKMFKDDELFNFKIK